ncbi:hypothetical protein GCM10027299_25280 [Larkinella ripae]
MRTAKKNYTNAQLELLYGSIKDTNYTNEVIAVLGEWVKSGVLPKKFKKIDANRVRLTVHLTIRKIEADKADPENTVKQYYIEEVWDAIVEVLKRRKAKAQKKTAQLEEVFA